MAQEERHKLLRAAVLPSCHFQLPGHFLCETTSHEPRYLLFTSSFQTPGTDAYRAKERSPGRVSLRKLRGAGPAGRALPCGTRCAARCRVRAAGRRERSCTRGRYRGVRNAGSGAGGTRPPEPRPARVSPPLQGVRCWLCCAR